MWKNKLLMILVSTFFFLSIKAQEQKEAVLKTDVSEVTVFINGAQILRKKTVDLLPGKTKLRFTNLSPYIDAKSVQIKMDGDAMVMSVNHQSSFIDSLKKPLVIKTDDVLLKEIENKITLAKTEREIIKEEQAFLAENRKIGGANTGVSLMSLRETANYYRERISILKKKDNELYDNIELLERQRKAILNDEKQDGNIQMGATRTPIGEVVVEVECKKATHVNIDLTYYVKNASWYPTYDIRAINTDKPIQLVYKANVHQNTKEDWKNVKLKISSADPNQGNVVPQLRSYLLNYYTAPPRYDVQANNGQISGVVTDGKEPLMGTSVVVKGTTIGTVTDLNGHFSLAIPQNGKELTFSYVGFISKTLPISQSFMDVRLEEDNATLDEVVVVGYGTARKTNLTGSVAGIQMTPAAPKPSVVKEFVRTDIAMPTAQVENQTVVEFEVNTPYSIKSDNKNSTIEVDRYELPADYEYFAIPKISKDAFLLANITDWEKYNLLEGEANIFFENTYIGKTILDTRYVSDTLNISLGRDKSILVSREKGRDYNSKKFLGTKKEDTREWKINVRNNKTQAIDFVVLDQVPVSTISEIEVNVESLSGGDLNAETGEVKWKLKLKPSEKKELGLKYKVKYPKDRALTVE